LIVYLDTSIVLRILFGEPDPLQEWGAWEIGYSSELLRVEARRTIDRLRLGSALDDEDVAASRQQLDTIETGLGFMPVTKTVLHRASLPMATAVRTLDALHVVSALLVQERRGVGVVFATHDRSQATAARAMGLKVIGT
jgi:predicted nucleic acid-binding protein